MSTGAVRITPANITNPAREQAPPGRGEALDVEWCAEKASEALRYLAVNYPECSGSEALHTHQDAAHAAAIAGDGPRGTSRLCGAI